MADPGAAQPLVRAFFQPVGVAELHGELDAGRQSG